MQLQILEKERDVAEKDRHLAEMELKVLKVKQALSVASSRSMASSEPRARGAVGASSSALARPQAPEVVS